MARRVATLLLFLMLAAPSAFAATELEKRVGVLLSAIHELPARERFLELADAKDVRAVLLAFARDPRLFPLHRARALEALGYFKDAEIAALYESVIAAPDTKDALRVRLFALEARHFPHDAERVLAPWLLHPDASLRNAAEHARTTAATAAPR